jgi:hypothetical protein
MSHPGTQAPFSQTWPFEHDTTGMHPDLVPSELHETWLTQKL